MRLYSLFKNQIALEISLWIPTLVESDRQKDRRWFYLVWLGAASDGVYRRTLDRVDALAHHSSPAPAAVHQGYKYDIYLAEVG